MLQSIVVSFSCVAKPSICSRCKVIYRYCMYQSMETYCICFIDLQYKRGVFAKMNWETRSSV